MQPTLFYAWQSDADEKANRYLIRDAAEKALKSIMAEGQIDDAPRLDHDTRDASGTPEIAGTIFEKIKVAGLFLADVTLVGKIEQPDKEPKLMPNPNVLIELGFAAGIMGWDRIILVLNENYGPPDKLPFDLKHRRFPITYKLAPSDDKAGPRQSLARDLAGQIKLAMAADHDRVMRVIGQLSLTSMMLLEHNAHKENLWFHPDMKYKDVTPALIGAEQAMTQLLMLEVIETQKVQTTRNPDIPDGVKFAYGWTYLGDLVLRRLGFKPTNCLSENPCSS